MLSETFTPPADFVELGEADGLRLDLRYASSNNLMGRDLYGAFNTLLLHRIAADKLRHAVRLLEAMAPDHRLLVFDGLRPNRIQRVFWDAVVGTPQEPYVADPRIGSMHGYGFAVDLSLVDGLGREADMGTPFDDLTPLAEPQLEARFLDEGLLSASHIANRLLLRHAMEGAGFQHLPNEWWHFDALPADVVRSTYRLIE